MTLAVSLRPLVAADLEAMWAARTNADAPWTDTSEDARRKLRERIGASGRFTNGEILLGITSDGRLAGEIQGRQPEMGLPRGVFEIGIEVFDPAERGTGIGRRALELFVAHLFAEEQAHRIQLSTDIDNAAMRRVAERVGFTCEGTLRGFMPSPEGLRDYLMYAMTREDYERVKDGWTSIG
jgi:RimJ/RimL family protein N-acetyltransferase